MKKFLILIMVLICGVQIVQSAEYDTSIDSEIRQKYKAEELPPLPNVAATQRIEMPKENTNYNVTGKTYTIKSGTKIVLFSKSKISNWTSEGTKVSFLSQNQIVTKEGAVIPAGTLFKGTVVNSHSPQITGNGGLIKLKIDEIYYNGVMSFIDTKLNMANSKKIYASNIKGNRKYWQNCKKAMTPGIKTYSAMKNVANDMSHFPVINAISFIPYTIGGAAYIINLPLAPVASVFMKGNSITLPAETIFNVTVAGNNQIRG